MNSNSMTSKQAAEYIGVSVNTLRKYVHEEGLPVLKFPGRRKWIFRKDLIDDWIEKQSKPEIYVNNEPVKEYGKLRVLLP
ncbi:helix-turn-helix domain-containing protein [Caldifermentibacillus hisashii]|uniref:helix-turn-helix domain-containing protein n=1 Tax=Caldifermentibacillus hisashii TaxID=996558 RepID=UPI0031B6D250